MRLRCLAGALILVAAFASDSWGQSKQPSAKAGQQSAGQQERGTNNSPVVVKVIPTEKSKDELAREDAKDKEKLAVDNRIASLTGDLAFYTKLLFGATAVLALITVCLVIASFRQVSDARKSIAAAVKSADAAKLNATAVINADRAHLYVIIKEHNLSELISSVAGFKFSEAIAKDRLDPPILSYVFKNYGKTPAIIESVMHCVALKKDEGGTRTYVAIDRAIEIVGGSDESELIVTSFEERPFLAEDAKALGDCDIELFFYSEATFRDAFNQRHTITSDFFYSADRFHLIGRKETTEET